MRASTAVIAPMATTTPARTPTTRRAPPRLRREPPCCRLACSRGGRSAGWFGARVLPVAGGTRITRSWLPARRSDWAYTADPTVATNEPTSAPMMVPATPRNEAASADVAAARALPRTWARLRPKKVSEGCRVVGGESRRVDWDEVTLDGMGAAVFLMWGTGDTRRHCRAAAAGYVTSLWPC